MELGRGPFLRQAIRETLHAPAFARLDWGGNRALVEGDVLSSPPAHPKRYAIEPIAPPDALPIDRSAFTPEQHPDPHVAEQRAGMGQIPNPHPESGVVLRPTSTIPGGLTELASRQARALLT